MRCASSVVSSERVLAVLAASELTRGERSQQTRSRLTSEQRAAAEEQSHSSIGGGSRRLVRCATSAVCLSAISRLSRPRCDGSARALGSAADPLFLPCPGSCLARASAVQIQLCSSLPLLSSRARHFSICSSRHEPSHHPCATHRSKSGRRRARLGCTHAARRRGVGVSARSRLLCRSCR